MFLKKDEVSGSIEVQLQYKYTSSWESLYSGIKSVERGDYEKGIENLSKAIDKFPHEIRLFETRSQAYIATNQLKLALADAIKVREINPNIPNVNN